MTKKYLLMFCMIFLMASVSAWEWDNSIDYSEDKLTVAFENAWGIPLIGELLGTAELTSHEADNGIIQGKMGLAGKDKTYMWYNFNFEEIYENGLGDVKIIDMNTGKEIEKDFYFSIGNITGYDTFTHEISDECWNEESANGTIKVCNYTETYEPIYEWTKYNSRDIPKGEAIIGVTMDYSYGENIDIVWTIVGKEVSEHAIVYIIDTHGESWSTASNDLKNGLKIMPIHNNITIVSFNISGNTSGITTCYIMNASESILNTSTSISGLKVSISYDLTYQKEYILSCDAGGSSYTITYSNVLSFPISGNYINWTNGYLQGEPSFGNTGRIRNIDSITSFNTSELVPPDAPPTITLNAPANNSNFSVNNVEFNYTIEDDFNISNYSFYINNILNYTITYGVDNKTTNVSTLNFPDGTYTWKVLASDNWTQTTNSSTRTFIVDTTPPNITIIHPTEGQLLVSSTPTLNVSLNWTLTEINPESCWYYNGTSNVSIPSCLNYNVTIPYLPNGNNTIILYANDSIGNVGSDSVGFFINYVYENASFNATSIELNSETFNLNVTANLITQFNGSFHYNNTKYTATYSNNATRGLLSATISVPEVSVTTNISFYWDYWLNGINYNSSNYSQIIYNIPDLYTNVTCTATLYPARCFNFADEQNLTTFNGTIDYNFKYGIANSTYITSTGSLSNINEFCVCINTTISDTYTMGYSEIQYSKTSYDDRRYYAFTNAQLTNTTQTNTTLYSLFSSEASSFSFEILQPDLSPYEEKYITLNKWYPASNEYKIVEVAKTDNKGESVMKIQTEDTDYRVGIYHPNGSLIYLASAIRFVCASSPCSYTLTIPDDASNLFENWNNLQYSLTYTSGTFDFVYSDPSQETENITLKVYRDTGTSSTLICNTSISSYAGSLSCNVSAWSGTLRAVASRTASPDTPIAVKIYSAISGGLTSSNGLFIVLIGLILMILMGLASPVASIVFGILGFTLAVVFGILPYYILIILAFMGFIVIHFMRRSIQ